jgi:catechol-2,3-dioxygenase
LDRLAASALSNIVLFALQLHSYDRICALGTQYRAERSPPCPEFGPNFLVAEVNKRGRRAENLEQENTTMTQTLNAFDTRLSVSKESLAKKASTGKQAGRQDARIGHVGLCATNPAASAEFYRDVFGMEIVGGTAPDHPLGATAFLTSRPGEEPHEIALFANPEFAHIAFKVSSLAEFRSFHAGVVEKNIPIKFVFNHHVSFAFYFDDPNGNMIEVYWPTGDLSRGEPSEPLDLSQADEVLLEKITATA